MGIDKFTRIFLTLLVFIAISFYWWWTGGDTSGTLFFLGWGIIVTVLMIAKESIENNQAKVSKTLRNFGLLPQPTEASMFVMASTVIGLITLNNAWSLFWNSLIDAESSRGFLLAGYILTGIGLSVFHVFTKRVKSDFEIGTMKIFLMFTLVFVSVSTAFYVYQEQKPGYMILAVWNGLQAIILIFFSGKRHIGEYVNVPTKDATKVEVFIGLIVVVVVLLIAHVWLRTHWLVTFSSVMIVWSLIEGYFSQNVLESSHGRNT